MKAIRFSRLSRSTTVLLAGLFLIAGCGKNRIVLDIDVLSFMDPETLTNAYDVPPGPPASVRLEPVQVNLVEGFEDFGQAESITLDIALQYDNETGQGQGSFRIYFDVDEASTFADVPVTSIDVVLEPGATTTESVRLEADQKLIDLFSSKQLWMGIEMEWESGSVEPLGGQYTITVIHAKLVSQVDLF